MGAKFLSEAQVTLRNQQYYFKEGFTWTTVSSGGFSARYSPPGALFDNGGCTLFSDENLDTFGALLNSRIASRYLEFLSPTLNFQPGDIGKILLPTGALDIAVETKELVKLAKCDWDSYEFSWDFKCNALLSKKIKCPTLKHSLLSARQLWNERTTKLKALEEKNNSTFNRAYGLDDQIDFTISLNEITLTCNPHYRYGGNLTDEEREVRLQSDTICELISYVIGCMMGRYSLDREGLVYAHAGNEGFKALVEEGAYATFAADDDGILPLTQENWFEDDVAARIEQFVASVWGSEHLEENLHFIADSLCLYAIKPVKKGGETARETIRRYLSTQFYKDHLKTYKKRPIYWLFSSGKEKAFECLVYLHRYNEATLPRMRTEYVTPLLGQIASRIERKRLEQTEASTAEAKRIAKDIDSLNKQLSELRAFDDALKHHADMRISLDLDDGVKVNYGKFGNLLSDVKAITGGKDE
ncbi:MAG: BREX-1 system adenine-specific DNA-methyltransferase PglX [Shewanella xiamenensis]|nr:BREX-1 system adenine-specific DNA-methyltransferase PglX [Shewanella xiamenensis]